MLEFFGIFALINGVLFGLLSVLAITGITSLKSWNEINLSPAHTLVACTIIVGVGIIVFLTGRISNRNHKENKSPLQ
jgi:heme A synthase